MLKCCMVPLTNLSRFSTYDLIREVIVSHCEKSSTNYSENPDLNQEFFEQLEESMYFFFDPI